MDIRDFELERFFSLHEFNARHMLCGSDCESLAVRDLLALNPAYASKLMDLGLGYTESNGHPELRHEISKLYDGMDPDDVLVFSGAEEGIFAFMNTVLHKGDHAIVQYPAYQSLYEVANAIGAEVTLLGMREDDGWSLDLDALDSSLRPETKLVVLNSPHNPTGHVICKADLRRIRDITEGRGVYVFSDEVYRFLSNEGAADMPSLADHGDWCFSLGVMSKSFGLAGLRIGWIASKDRQMIKRLSAFKDYTSICSSAPSELLSIMALQNKDMILSRTRRIIQDNLSLFEAFLEEHSDKLEWVRPQGGSTGFPRLLSGKSSWDLAEDVLGKKGVLLLPSRCFGYGDSHFRVGLGRLGFSEGLAKLDEYMHDGYRGLK